MNYAYSTDEENYTGSFDTPEEAVAEAFGEDDDIETVFVGEERPPICSEYLDADILFEHITCQDDYSIECGDGTFEHVKKEAKDDLTRKLRLMFDSWMDEWDERPKFFVINQSKEWSREEAEAAGLLEEKTAPICAHCNGSGEGRYDGGKCNWCGGGGTERARKEETK